MVKGASIKFRSYSETVPKILELLKVQYEIKKYDKIVIKPFLSEDQDQSTPKDFVEQVIRFCLQHKNPVTEIFIAEGADGLSTEELFEMSGYNKLAEQYNISLIDLNTTESEEIRSSEFLKFQAINYPKVLLGSFLISLAKVSNHEEFGITGTISNMLSAFPSSHYKGFFSREKNKIRKWPIKYSIHDISRIKMPDFALVDASSQGVIMAGLPLELDKQLAKMLSKDWRQVPYIRLMDESLPKDTPKLVPPQ